MNVCLTLKTLQPFLYQLNPTTWNSSAFGIIAAFLLLLKNPSIAAGIGLLKRGIECVPIASVAGRLWIDPRSEADHVVSNANENIQMRLLSSWRKIHITMQSSCIQENVGVTARCSGGGQEISVSFLMSSEQQEVKLSLPSSPKCLRGQTLIDQSPPPCADL